MLQKYHALFSSYFETNGELKNCKEPETFVMGLIPLLECAEKDFKPHITYKKLHESCANGTFEIQYGLGRRTERLGVLNPSQYVKYIVSNVKAGRLVKHRPTKNRPAFCYWFQEGYPIRSMSYDDLPAGEDTDRITEDAFLYTANNSTLCVVYSGGSCREDVWESYHDLWLLFWTNDLSGNTVRMFQAGRMLSNWELRYEETQFDQNVAVRLWNAEVFPYNEELFSKIDHMLRELGHNTITLPVVDGHTVSIKEYDLGEF